MQYRNSTFKKQWGHYYYLCEVKIILLFFFNGDFVLLICSIFFWCLMRRKQFWKWGANSFVEYKLLKGIHTRHTDTKNISFFFIFQQSSIMMMKKKWVRDGGKDWFLWPLKMRSRSCSNCWWKNANKTSIVVFRPWYVSLQLRSRIKWSKKKYDFWVQIRGPPPAPSSLLVRSFFVNTTITS